MHLDLDTVLTVYAALLGLVVGSYLNVVVYRLPRHISTVTPSSRCPRCRSAIRPWDNIPLLSYLLLGGRCRDCRLAIHWRYPAVEALTGVLFAASYLRFRPSLLHVAVAGLMSATMVVLAMIDLEHFLLPDAITWPGIAIGLLVLPRLGWISDRDAWIGALAGGGFLLAVVWGWYFLKGVHGMGLGDVKMLALIGAVLGWQGTAATLFVASLLGSAVGLSLMALGRLGMKSRLPFGVFLAVGALVTLFFRQDLLGLYDGVGRITVEWFYGRWGLG